jgi:hypothetical protein
VLKKNGFMEAYAHYGKGLIIYDGFDNDQAGGVAYRQLVTREREGVARGLPLQQDPRDLG